MTSIVFPIVFPIINTHTQSRSTMLLVLFLLGFSSAQKGGTSFYKLVPKCPGGKLPLVDENDTPLGCLPSSKIYKCPSQDSVCWYDGLNFLCCPMDNTPPTFPGYVPPPPQVPLGAGHETEHQQDNKAQSAFLGRDPRFSGLQTLNRSPPEIVESALLRRLGFEENPISHQIHIDEQSLEEEQHLMPTVSQPPNELSIEEVQFTNEAPKPPKLHFFGANFDEEPENKLAEESIPKDVPWTKPNFNEDNQLPGGTIPKNALLAAIEDGIKEAEAKIASRSNVQTFFQNNPQPSISVLNPQPSVPNPSISVPQPKTQLSAIIAKIQGPNEPIPAQESVMTLPIESDFQRQIIQPQPLSIVANDQPFAEPRQNIVAGPVEEDPSRDATLQYLLQELRGNGRYRELYYYPQGKNQEPIRLGGPPPAPRNVPVGSPLRSQSAPGIPDGYSHAYARWMTRYGTRYY